MAQFVFLTSIIRLLCFSGKAEKLKAEDSPSSCQLYRKQFGCFFTSLGNLQSYMQCQKRGIPEPRPPKVTEPAESQPVANTCF